ncbi:MAG: alanine racemase [Candidatus Limnocylindrales bacterium]
MDERLAAAALPSLPRRVWAEIDESALAGNLGAVRELIGPRVELNAVIKADAYGHGLVPVGRVFEQAGADRLCVAGIDEATALRDAGIALPILVLFPVPLGEVARAARSRFEIVAADRTTTLATLEAWSRQRGSADPDLLVHLEVETGLARGGFKPDHVPSIAMRIAATPGVRLAGLWSHLARSEDRSTTAAQVAAFELASDAIRAAGLALPPRHLAATGGLFAGQVDQYEGVRIGLGLYGLMPDGFPVGESAKSAFAKLTPAMAVKCRPLRVEDFPQGTPVSYGGLWTTERPSRIATLPIGYGDGWARAYAPLAGALVRGHRVPLVGSVAMDAVMADVTDVGDVGTEEEFVLIGAQGGRAVVTNELARVRTTIPWEVVTSMAYRLPRVYHAGPVLKGLRTLAGEARVGSNAG